MSGAERVHYFDGQSLGVADFEDEQTYQLAQRRRHQAGPHSWGIVGGLGLSLRDGRVLVEPGYAIDGYGRDLVLTAPRWLELPAPETALGSPGRFEVRLSWNRRPATQPPAGRPDAFARWDESPDLAVVAEAAAALPDFSPWLDPPDDPAMTWPVRLGALAVDPTGRYLADLSGRRPAGLVACEIVAPAGDARLALGSAAAGDDTLLAVRTGADASDRLRLAADGTLTVAGPATLSGGARLAAGTVAFAAAGPDPAEPGFRLRRATGADGVAELRIELVPGGRLTIGAWSDTDKALKPALTVTADGVAVAGHLVVSGQINPQPVPPLIAQLSSDAQQMVKSAQLAALSQEIAQSLAPKPPAGMLASLFGGLAKALETAKPILGKLAAIGGSGLLVTAGATLGHLFPETAAYLKPVAEQIRALLALIAGHA